VYIRGGYLMLMDSLGGDGGGFLSNRLEFSS